MQLSTDGARLKIATLALTQVTACDLEIALGDVVALSAPSGTGKSLFMRALADLIPNEGRVFLNGQERAGIPAPVWRQKVIYVAPKSAWWFDRVGDHFDSPDWLRGKLADLDLPTEAVNWPVSRLSGGESQRLSLLRALEKCEGVDEDGRYLLLDEPTSALDQARQVLVERFLQSYLDQRRIGILLVSHDERQSQRFAHKHWQFIEGEIKVVESAP